MSLQFASLRAAEEFARVLDGSAGLEPAVAERYAALAHTATLLRERPKPSPRPDFVLELRERLLAAADEILVVDPDVASLSVARARRGRRRDRVLGTAVAGIVLVGGTAGLAAAAEGSLPGDQLYPVKRGIEHVEVSLTPNSAARGRELLGQAGTRLEEVQALVDNPSQPVPVNLVTSTLHDFTSSANTGAELLFTSYQGKGNAGDISDVRNFTANRMSLLESLAKQSPPTASEAFSQAGQTLADIDQQARVLCVACGSTGPVVLPDALVNLVSARSLDMLVTVPTAQAGRAYDLAGSARTRHHQSRHGHNTAATTKQPKKHGHSGSGLSQEPSQLAGSQTAPVHQPKAGPQPVQDLLNGITSAAPAGPSPTGSGKTNGKPTGGLSGGVGDVIGSGGNLAGSVAKDLGNGLGNGLGVDPNGPDQDKK